MRPLTRRDCLDATAWAAGCFLLTGLLTFPRDFVALGYYTAGEVSGGGRLEKSYLPLCDDPWNADTPLYPQVRHRVLGPAVAHYLGLRGPAAALVAPLANFFLFAAVYLAVRRRLTPGDAALAAVLTATTLAALTSVTWPGLQDSLAHLGVALCLLAPWPPVGALCLFAAAFADERAFAAVPLVLLWHGLDDPPPAALRRALVRLACYAAALAAWYACASALMAHLHIDAQTVREYADHDVKRYARTALGGLYAPFRALWLFPLALLWLWGRSRPLFCALFIAAFLPLVASALVVADVSRVMAFALPGVLLGYVAVRRADPVRGRWLAWVALAVNVISPVFQVHGQHDTHLGSAFDHLLMKWLTGNLLYP